MAAETEGVAGAHNNQPTDGSNSDKNGVLLAAAAATAAAVAAAVATAAMAAMTATAAAQTVAAVMAASEIYIKKWLKQRSWWR